MAREDGHPLAEQLGGRDGGAAGLHVLGLLAHGDHDAVDTLEKLVTDENIDCDFARTGKLNLASRPAHFDGLRRTHEIMSGRLGLETRLVSKSELRSEIGSDLYHGAMVEARSAGLHVGKFTTEVFPQLTQARVDYCWGGLVDMSPPGRSSRNVCRELPGPVTPRSSIMAVVEDVRLGEEITDGVDRCGDRRYSALRPGTGRPGAPARPRAAGPPKSPAPAQADRVEADRRPRPCYAEAVRRTSRRTAVPTGAGQTLPAATTFRSSSPS